MAPTGPKTRPSPRGWKPYDASLELAIWTLKTLNASPTNVGVALLAIELQKKLLIRSAASLSNATSEPSPAGPTGMEESDDHSETSKS